MKKRRGPGERNALGATLGLDLQEPARRFGQRLVPTDSNPARIGFFGTFWVGAFHREFDYLPSL